MTIHVSLTWLLFTAAKLVGLYFYVIFLALILWGPNVDRRYITTTRAVIFWVMVALYLFLAFFPVHWSVSL